MLNITRGSHNKYFSSIKLTKSLRIACILDEFSYTSFAFECDLLQLTPDNYLDELTSFMPQILLVESAWFGWDNLWTRKIASSNKQLKAIIKWCNINQIPTVFWNKEDPVHFKTFKKIVPYFDFVFTTDLDCIARYKKICSHDRVYFMPFACQPKIHNPIEEFMRRYAVSFAGGFHSRYTDRIKDFDNMIDLLGSKMPIEIYDRYFGTISPGYNYPTKYQKYIIGGLAYDEINVAYKGYIFSLNMNSVKYSQGMMSRRVYELVASNTIVISNYSRATTVIWGDLVIASDDVKYIDLRLNLYNDIEYRDKVKLLGLRKVMLEHTYCHRLQFMIDKINNTKTPMRLPKVYIISYLNNYKQIDQVIAIINRQCHREYMDISTILLCTFETADLSVNNVQLVNLDYVPEQNIMDMFVSNAYVAIIDLEHYYGKFYLIDLILATEYSTNDTIITKANKFDYQVDKLVMSDVSNDCYRFTDYARLSCSLIPIVHIKKYGILNILSYKLIQSRTLVVDGYNYCHNGGTQVLANSTIDGEIAGLNEGISLDRINKLCTNNRSVPVISASDYLVVTNQYPNNQAIYRNWFVHSRVLEYKQNGLNIDVFELTNNNSLKFREFEGISVISANQHQLDTLVASDKYKVILIHCLNTKMWGVLSKYAGLVQYIIWVHGFEAQSWQHRRHNYATKLHIAYAAWQSSVRLKMWRNIFTVANLVNTIQFVFVSEYLIECIMNDIQVDIPREKYQIIHNYIDTNKFVYHPKDNRQRKKILSIRPYANHNYANDISVQVVLELSKTDIFHDLEFRFVGDGRLFEKTLKPLRHFSNVIIEQKFLTHDEIIKLHQEYGLFLVPTRMDTHGVSRDEAMSSGLVPLTNNVAAIPEFVDDSCAILAPANDHQKLVEGIQLLYYSPEAFTRMSRAASERVLQSRSITNTIYQELRMLEVIS